MDNDQKRMVAAVALSALILFGWQTYFAPKTPAPTTTTNHSAPTPTGTPGTEQIQAPSANAVSPVMEQPTVKDITLTGPNGAVKINNRLQIIDFNTTGTVFTFADTVGTGGVVTDALGFDLLPPGEVFSISQADSNGMNFSSASGDINGKFTLDEQNRLKFVLNTNGANKLNLHFDSSPKAIENQSHRELVTFNGLKAQRYEIGKKTEEFSKIKWLGIDFNYHLFAIVFNDTVDGTFLVNEGKNVYFKSAENIKTLEGYLVYTKKNYDALIALGDNLHHSVNFGWLGVVAVPILRGLQFFYNSFFPNWGIAIILLTIAVRFVLFPLQWKSFKSMKKMQVIQPELAKIREKYKEDPQKLQKESMELFKRNGANPIGGCLPLLLQMPVFFAFYKVLYAAVELVGAPFFGWINDLSLKDPFYVLPVLMTIFMFLQQRMTPSPTIDPVQKKIMMFMPLVVGFIMKDLPAGLTLYILVSTIFGILQQLLVYRMNK